MSRSALVRISTARVPLERWRETLGTYLPRNGWTVIIEGSARHKKHRTQRAGGGVWEDLSTASMAAPLSSYDDNAPRSTPSGPRGITRVSPMAATGAPVQHERERASKGYVLPPLESKYERALARHYSLKYPPSSPVEVDTYSQEWIDGNATVDSTLPTTQSSLARLKTPNCPWGVDRKRFRPADSVVTQVRAATSKPIRLHETVRSRSSMATLPPRMSTGLRAEDLGKVVPQVIPGYTGHFTGFRETVGKTHGHAGEVLGRMSPAFIPMYRKEDVVGDEMGICRSGYPSFVRHEKRWSRRPDTAMRPLVKNPLMREAGKDIVKHLSNMLIERVPGECVRELRG